MNKNITQIPLKKLSQDLENPRLPLAFRKNQHTQDSIINWLLEDAPIIEDNAFYKIPSLDETSFHFTYIADSFAKEHIRQFIGVDLNLEKPLEHLNEAHLEELINWFFRKNEKQ